MKRPSPTSLLLISMVAVLIVVAVASAISLSHLKWQAELQDQWSKVDGTTLSADSHWLMEWLPEHLAADLPGQDLQLHFHGNEGLDEATKIAMGLSNIYGVQYDCCDLTSNHWQLIVRNPSLKWIWLEDSPIGDQQLGLLHKHRQLEWLYIENSLLTDASLAEFGALPSLKEVELHDSNISIAAIKQFAAVNPQIKVTYSPRLPHAQRLLKYELHKLGVDVRPSQDSGIANTIRWKVNFRNASTAEHLRQVQALGVVDEVAFWEPTDRATIDEIATWTTLVQVEWMRRPAADHISRVAASPTVQRMKFRFNELPPKDLRELKEKYGDRIINYDPHAAF